MRTKLSVFCDRLIEAGWLTAVLVVPTLFSVYTNDRYMINKACIVRSLALVMALAWIIRTVERWPPAREDETAGNLWQRADQLLRRPLVLPALLTIAVTLLTTVTSIWPHGSFWGSYDRRQGAYTTLSYVAISLLVLDRLRDREQMKRLATVTALGSLPVCIFALAQHHYGLLPTPFVAQFGGRVASSLGNPIFLGAYLIMVVPVTLTQVFRSLRHLRADGTNVLPGVWMTGMYSLLVAVQLYVVLLTQSRGPALALLVGLIVYIVLWAVHAARHTVGLASIGLALLVVCLLVAVNVSGTLSATVRDLPYVGRLSTILGATTLQQRTLIWQGAVDLSASSPLRLLLGYGPESMDLAFYGHYPPELVAFEGAGSTADRSHNAVLDALVNTGLVGSAIYLFLFCSLFGYGLRALGLMGTGRQRRILGALLGGGGIVGLLIAWMAGGRRFAAVGISGGLLIGLLSYVTLFLLGVLERRGKQGSQHLLVIALLSAVVAHFAEVQVGIPVTATRLTLWLFAGALASAATSIKGRAEIAPRAALATGDPAAGGVDPRATGGGNNDASSPARVLQPDVAQLLPSTLLVGILLITTASGFITHQSDLLGEPFTAVFLLLVWLSAGLIVLGDSVRRAQSEEDALGWPQRLYFYAVPSLLCLFTFVVAHLFILNRFPAVSALPVVYYAMLLIVLAFTAVALMGDAPLPDRFWRADRWWLYPILTVAILALIITTNLNWVRADICFHLGRVYRQQNRWDESLAFHQQAVDLAPSQDRYVQFLGHAYLKKAQPNTAQRPIWFARSEEALQRAVEISPLNPDHHGNLGNMYHAWADVTEDPEAKGEKLTKALANYQESVRMAPQTHGRLLAEAMFDAHLALANNYVKLGDIDQAIQEAEAAADLAPPGEREQLEAFITWLRDQEG